MKNNNPINPDRESDLLQMLKGEYLIVGKKRIHAWHAWLIIGLVVGIFSGIMLVANQQGEVAPLLAMSAPAASPSYPAQAVNSTPGEILLKFKDKVSAEVQDKFLKARGLAIKNEIAQIKVKVVSVPEEAEDEIIAALSHRPEIDFAQRNMILAPSLIPNDPSYSSQWHHQKINDPVAWDSVNGAPLIIGIADSGADPTHPDLAANLVPGWNFYDNNSNTSDVYGHGTKVAGAQAAIGNNGAQIAGVAWEAKIMPLRVTDTAGYGYSSTVSSAITYAADHGAKTVNVSFGGVCGDGAIASAADYLYKKGGLVVAAVGNEGTLINCNDNPEMVFAAATDSADTRASWSSYGPYVDVAAPGVSILTTTNGGGIGSVSGTSFSSPVTAGVLALIWAVNPSLSPSQAGQVLFNSALDLGAVGRDQYFGLGRVNAAAAVALAKETSGPPPDSTPPTTSLDSPASGATVVGSISVSASASDLVGVSRVELWKDGVLFGADTSFPYSYLWDTTKDINGSHTLQSKAYDAAGNVGASSLITVTVNNLVDTRTPSVSITQPANNSTLSSKGNTTIAVSASDNVGVSEIDILFDGALRKSCFGVTTCSYGLNSRKVSSGAHTITATAFDAAGNKGSASITITK